MTVKSTIDFGKARKALLSKARQVMSACEPELNERIGHYLHDRMKDFAPVDTGELWNSIVLVSAGGMVPLASGSVIVGVGLGPEQVHVVSYAPYSMYVSYGHFAGKTHVWVPPNPYVQNAVAATLGAFREIVNMEAFLPFRGGSGWRELEMTAMGSANKFLPLAGPTE